MLWPRPAGSENTYRVARYQGKRQRVCQRCLRKRQAPCRRATRAPLQIGVRFAGQDQAKRRKLRRLPQALKRKVEGSSLGVLRVAKLFDLFFERVNPLAHCPRRLAPAVLRCLCASASIPCGRGCQCRPSTVFAQQKRSPLYSGLHLRCLTSL